MGLFNELASPFENEFKKASEDDIKKVCWPYGKVTANSFFQGPESFHSFHNVDELLYMGNYGPKINVFYFIFVPEMNLFINISMPVCYVEKTQA